MFGRIVVLLALTWITTELYTKAHSALVDNGVYFFHRLEYKMDVNPIFHNTDAQHQIGMCSSKAGPRCSVKTPESSFTNNPLEGLMNTEQTASYLKAFQTARLQSPYMEKYIRDQVRLIFLPADAVKEYDRVLQPQYQ